MLRTVWKRWSIAALTTAAVAGSVAISTAQPPLAAPQRSSSAPNAAATGRPTSPRRSPSEANPGQGFEPVVRVTSRNSTVRLTEKSARIIELSNRISTAYGFDPEVISVTKVEFSPHRIRVHALTPGVTTITLTDEKNENFNVELFVTGDVRHLQAYISQLFPHAAVEAVPIREAVVLRGWVTQPEHITEIVEIAERFYPKVLNQMKVGGVQQVQLNVRVMEVQRSRIRRMGFNFLYLNDNGYLVSTPGEMVPLTALATPLGGPPALALSSAALSTPNLSGGIVNNSNAFQGFLQAMKDEQLLKILAEPKLITTNGRPANMLAGGEFPILVPQSLGTVTVEWRQFGVRMQAVPIILGNGRVRLELEPEVSERDFSNSVTTNGLTVPGLTSRRVNTQVEMRFGQTFMLAGLISMRQTAETHKVPFLGELPWIGSLFSRIRYDDAETELVIMVTPELVAPMGPGQVPPRGPGMSTDIPTDRELFHYGLTEVPKHGDHCVDCGTDLPPLISPAPGVVPQGIPLPQGSPSTQGPTLADPMDSGASNGAKQKQETREVPRRDASPAPAETRGRQKPQQSGDPRKAVTRRRYRPFSREPDQLVNPNRPVDYSGITSPNRNVLPVGRFDTSDEPEESRRDNRSSPGFESESGLIEP